MKTSRMKVTIIIATWNKEKLLKECLKSLKKQTFKKFRIIVVDNASLDGTVGFLNKRYPNIKIIKLGKNLGFSKAVNKGIKVSETEYIILLNNDTVVDKNFVKYLVVFLNKHKYYCACTSKMIDFSNRNVVLSAGDIMNNLGQSFPRGLGDDIRKWDKAEEVFLITGGASIFRKKTFDKIGYFDEDFFIYGEDTDWCFRAQIAGYKFYYEPKAIAYHHCKATSKDMPKVVEYLQFRNMVLTILKGFPQKLFLRKGRFIGMILVHLNTIFYMTIKGFLKEAIMADLWILFHLPKILRERSLIQSKRKVTIRYIENWLCPKKVRLFGLLK